MTNPMSTRIQAIVENCARFVIFERNDTATRDLLEYDIEVELEGLKFQNLIMDYKIVIHPPTSEPKVEGVVYYQIEPERWIELEFGIGPSEVT